MIPTASSTIVIPSRFNGPRESGNGGYSSGAVAALIDGPAEVSLRAPVPLDTPLAVDQRDDGEVHVSSGDTLIATARPAPELELAVPPPVGLAEARQAAAAYRGSGYGVLDRCYV